MIVLNPGQQKIYDEAIDWFYNSSEQVFEIDGDAGTGKSVLIGAILRGLNLNVSEYMPMAYTGQASIVMRTKGFRNAKSIHSSLYEFVEVADTSNINTVFHIPSTKMVFRPVLAIDPRVRLFFIDEAYMVPNRMVKDILKYGVKVIVCGDTKQLPPIGDDPGFLTGYNIHHLTEHMRQAADNPILYIADRASKGLPIHNGSYGKNVLVVNDTDISFFPELMAYADCVCCGTNKTRELLNHKVRELAGYTARFPYNGERVICRNNNWQISQDGIALANGLCGIVNGPVKLDDKNPESFFMNFKPDLLDQGFIDLQIDSNYYFADYQTKNEIKNSRFRGDKGELFELAYALTTHLCQGSEYRNGVYIEEFLKSQIQNQLNYTGITRFKESLVYVKKSKKYY